MNGDSQKRNYKYVDSRGIQREYSHKFQGVKKNNTGLLPQPDLGIYF